MTTSQGELPTAGARLPRSLLILLTLGASWLVFMGIRETSDVIAPLFLVVNLWIVAYPVQRWLAQMRAPAIVGALAVAVIILVILAVFAFAIAWSVSALVSELSKPEYQARYSELYQSLITWLESIGITQTQILEQINSISPASIAGWLGPALGGVSGTASWSLAFFTIFVGIITDAPSLLDRFVSGARTQPQVVGSIVGFAQGVRRYWVVAAIFGFIVAVADVILLEIMGVPLALVWGVLSFLTNFIPVIGFIIGVIPPTVMALFAKDPMTALLVFVLYFAVNASIQSFIQPRFNGNAVGVTATMSILSLLVWSAALGPMGALLGLPATLLVKALLIDPDPQLRWVNAYIAAEPDSAYEESELKKSTTARVIVNRAERKGGRVPALIARLASGEAVLDSESATPEVIPVRKNRKERRAARKRAKELARAQRSGEIQVVRPSSRQPSAPSAGSGPSAGGPAGGPGGGRAGSSPSAQSASPSARSAPTAATRPVPPTDLPDGHRPTQVVPRPGAQGQRGQQGQARPQGAAQGQRPQGGQAERPAQQGQQGQRAEGPQSQQAPQRPARQGQQGQPEQPADPGRRSAVQIPRITEQIRVRKTDEVPRPGEDSPKE